jgi:hypothetical protein
MKHILIALLFIVACDPKDDVIPDPLPVDHNKYLVFDFWGTSVGKTINYKLIVKDSLETTTLDSITGSFIYPSVHTVSDPYQMVINIGEHKPDYYYVDYTASCPTCVSTSSGCDGVINITTDSTDVCGRIVD